MRLPKYSIGIGDRFAHQGPAQLDALLLAERRGVRLAPVWNKSQREHTITGTRPEDVRAEADRAVSARAWPHPYFVDADHISLKSVERFLSASDFFTLDVAEFIGAAPDQQRLRAFVARCGRLAGELPLPGLDRPLAVTRQGIEQTARRYLRAAAEAGAIYRRIEQAKGAQSVVIEVSMDETPQPQTPLELLVILAALAEEGVPVQTIAPRFCGQFHKGVDYVGSVAQFAAEFEQDLAVVAFAAAEFGLPENLKLSVHSGSDKFSLYPPMRAALKRFDAGVHLKTAGTTWLEELIGLAAAAGEGLEIAKQIYQAAFERIDEMCGPYAAVIDIDRSKLPSPQEVARWESAAFVAALRHDQACPAFNPHFRQLLHVAYKVAAEMGRRFLNALEQHAETIAQLVTENLYRRHIVPLFLGD